MLGAAGLLQGRRATTQWAYTDLLPLVGTTCEKARVGTDSNVITAGGVTSGLDFGLGIAAALASTMVAQSFQLSLEYAPAPPFDAGHPDRASEEVKSSLSRRYEKLRRAYRDRLESVLAA